MKKISIITGAGGFLGFYHAKALLENNHNICITDINQKKLNILYNKLKLNFKSNTIIKYKLDVTKENQIKLLCKKLINNYTFDVLVNNAAIDFKVRKKNSKKKINLFESFDLKQWNKEINVGLTGYFLMSKIFGSQMSNNKYGRIINVASDLSVIAPDQRLYNENLKKIKILKPVTYSVIKHGVLGLTKYCSSLWGLNNVLCNSVSFGGALNNQPKKFQKKLANLIPMGRMGRPDEYMSVIKFLSDEKNSYLTGQNIVIDGGRTII